MNEQWELGKVPGIRQDLGACGTGQFALIDH